MLATFAIISFLQVPVGKEAKTLEVHFVNWMKRLSASRQITDVARGGRNLTRDFAKEFITSDGRRIVIKEELEKESLDGDGTPSRGKGQINSSILGRLMKGLKLDMNDLNAKAKTALKDQIKKEIEAQIRGEIEAQKKEEGQEDKKEDSLGYSF